MTKTQETGSRAYLFSIVLVAIIGGPAVRLRHGRGVGSRAGPRPVLPQCGGLQPTRRGMARASPASSALVAASSAGALSACWLASGTQTLARRGSRALLRLGHRLVAARKRHPALRRSVAAAAGVVQHLPHSGRYRRGTCLGRVSDVHCRNLAREDPRHARLVQPVRHHLRHAGRLLRQLPDPQPAGRHGRSHSGRHGLRRLAQDVPQRSVPRSDISAADPLCARNPALPDPHRTRSEGIAGAHAHQRRGRGPHDSHRNPPDGTRQDRAGSSPTAQR